jgi:general secretion pathway protein H
MRISDVPAILRKGQARGRASVSRRAAGFSLIEILIVIVLVGVLTATVVLSTGRDERERVKGAAEQLAYRMELARQYALQRNREWGVYVEENEVRFAEFDPDRRAWVEQTHRPFADFERPDNVLVRAETEGQDQISARDRERLPQVLLFSSGEVTPFEVFLEPQPKGQTWIVRSDGLSRVRAEPAEA